MALEVILRLDMAQEIRTLSNNEQDLRKQLKRKVVALAVLERARKKQSSRITLLKEGDANTRFFHLRINRQRRKNFIHRLRHNQGWVTNHDDKKAIVHEHFSTVIRKGPARSKDFNWEAIQTQPCDLTDLDLPFIEEETKAAIFSLPSDKAPGPDDFTGIFFKECWDIIKRDLMAVVNGWRASPTCAPLASPGST